jgi:hypothetical protein
MAEPVVFISRNRIKEGRIDDFRQHYSTSIQTTLEAKPGTLVQLAYEDDQAHEVTIVRIFPSAEALDQQIQGADERSKKTYEFIEPTGIEIFGTPSPDTVERMKKIAGMGIPVVIHPHYTGGFIRQGLEPQPD